MREPSSSSARVPVTVGWAAGRRPDYRRLSDASCAAKGTLAGARFAQRASRCFGPGACFIGDEKGRRRSPIKARRNDPSPLFSGGTL